MLIQLAGCNIKYHLFYLYSKGRENENKSQLSLNIYMCDRAEHNLKPTTFCLRSAACTSAHQKYINPRQEYSNIRDVEGV